MLLVVGLGHCHWCTGSGTINDVVSGGELSSSSLRWWWCSHHCSSHLSCQHTECSRVSKLSCCQRVRTQRNTLTVTCGIKEESSCTCSMLGTIQCRCPTHQMAGTVPRIQDSGRKRVPSSGNLLVAQSITRQTGLTRWAKKIRHTLFAWRSRKASRAWTCARSRKSNTNTPNCSGYSPWMDTPKATGVGIAAHQWWRWWGGLLLSCWAGGRAIVVVIGGEDCCWCCCAGSGAGCQLQSLIMKVQ